MIYLIVFTVLALATEATKHWWHDNTVCTGTSTDTLTLDDSSVTIAICGIVGAGKSSLIESLMNLEKGSIAQRGFKTGTLLSTVYERAVRNHVLRVIDTPGFGDANYPEEVINEATNCKLLAQEHGNFKRLYFVIDPTSRNGITFGSHLQMLGSIYGSPVVRAIRIIVNKSDRDEVAEDRDEIYSEILINMRMVFGDQYQLSQDRVMYLSARKCIEPLLRDIRQASREPDLDLSQSDDQAKRTGPDSVHSHTRNRAKRTGVPEMDPDRSQWHQRSAFLAPWIISSMIFRLLFALLCRWCKRKEFRSTKMFNAWVITYIVVSLLEIVNMLTFLGFAIFFAVQYNREQRA